MLKLIKQPFSLGIGNLFKVFDVENIAPVSSIFCMKKILILTDGRGGHPITIAQKLKKEHGMLIEVIGIAGSRSEVDEDLLRKVATTDHNGNHYQFINDSQILKEHYQNIATGLIYNDKN